MKPLPAFLRPAYHYLAFNLLYRARLRRPVSTSVNGFELLIEPSVMHPRIFKSGRIFARYLSSLELQGKDVLDVGTGSGVLALSAASRGARVTATDINPRAVRCAAGNVLRNGFASGIRVLEGSLFDPLPHQVFDTIIFNPPYFDKRQNLSNDPALFGGNDLGVIKEFSRRAAAFLKPGGCLLLILSSDADIRHILRMFSDGNFSAHLVHQYQTLFEEFFVYKFTPTVRTNEMFACPSCGGTLVVSSAGWECNHESLRFSAMNGIPDFILPGRRSILDQFLSTYQSVRRKERWGSQDTRYYRELPYRDLSGEHSDVWAIRAKSYDCLIELLTQDSQGEPQRILDLGAGNCWLSYRLSDSGHEVTAVDPNTDPYDGLGAAHRLREQGQMTFGVLRAEFDFLPFAKRFFDAIIFNASLHYATNPYETVKKATSFLKQNGRIYILDSPIYDKRESGESMVKERIGSFSPEEREKLPNEFSGSYLTLSGLDLLREAYDVDLFFPSYGLVWNLRPFLARLRGRRPPARFALIRIRNQSSGGHRAAR